MLANRANDRDDRAMRDVKLTARHHEERQRQLPCRIR